jgi:putative spermidine/putrescine transport system ATP-binding protein
MQRELKEIQQEVGITFIFVTHDQEEALSMADRIALFNHGRIEQLGSATEIYEHPASEFVAGFVGTSNLLRDEASQRILGKSGTFSIRPEKISISSSGDRRANGIIKNITYRGAHSTITVDLGDGAELNVLHPHDGQHGANLTLGQALEISWNSVHEFQVKP